MYRNNSLLLAIIISLAIAVAGLAHALVQCPPYAAGAAGASADQQPAQRASGDAHSPKAARGPATGGSSGKCQIQHGEGDEREFWSVFGFRLKVTDTFIAAFTGLLFVATLALWGATNGLAAGADKTAERQLRAYIFVSNTKLKQEGTDWKLTFTIKNFGQTPAHNVQLTSKTEAVNWNSGNPVFTAPDKTEVLGSMGPGGDWFTIERTVHGATTIEELNRSKTKAIYLVGRVTYLTVFEKKCTTNFRYYAGGDVGYTEGSMDADSTGNDARELA